MSYATLTELRAQIRIDDTVDDEELQIALDAAVGAVDDYCNRSFTVIDKTDDTAKTARLYTARSARRLIIDDAAKVDQVEEKNHRNDTFAVVDADEYDVEPANAETDDLVVTEIWREIDVWPKGRQLVRVTAWFGWPAVPAVVKQATLIQAARFAQRREAAFGVATVPSLEGGGMRLLSRLDADVELMLNAVRRDPTRQPV